jgi:hypothetical protein
MADIYIKRNDREPSVNAVLYGGDLAAVTAALSGGTLKFIMRQRGGTTTKVNSGATIVSAALRTVRYDWAAGDTDTAGQFDAEFEVTTSGGKKFSFPNGKHLEVQIAEDLA